MKTAAACRKLNCDLLLPVAYVAIISSKFQTIRVMYISLGSHPDTAWNAHHFTCSLLLLLSPVSLSTNNFHISCLALLTVLARRGFFGTVYALDLNSMSSSEGDSFGQATEDGKDVHPLNILFTEAIKGPLLSTDSQVQISTLDLLVHYMSCEGTSGREIQVLVEESIADYVFEILRLSG